MPDSTVISATHARAVAASAVEGENQAPPSAAFLDACLVLLHWLMGQSRVWEPEQQTAAQQIVSALLATCTATRDSVARMVPVCMVLNPADLRKETQTATAYVQQTVRRFATVHLHLRNDGPRRCDRITLLGLYHHLPEVLRSVAASMDKSHLVKVTKVVIKGLPLRDVILPWVPELCPNIRELSIIDCPVLPPIWHSLQLPTTPYNLPHLHHVHLNIPSTIRARPLPELWHQQLAALPHLASLDFLVQAQQGQLPQGLTKVTQLRLTTLQGSEYHIRTPVCANLATWVPMLRRLTLDYLYDLELEALLDHPPPALTELIVHESINLRKDSRAAPWPPNLRLSAPCIFVSSWLRLPLEKIPMAALAQDPCVKPTVPHGLLPVAVRRSRMNIRRLQEALQRWHAAGGFSDVKAVGITTALIGHDHTALLDAMRLVDALPHVRVLHITEFKLTAAVIWQVCAALPRRIRALRITEPTFGFERDPELVAQLIASLPQYVRSVCYGPFSDPRAEDSLDAACKSTHQHLWLTRRY